MQVTGPSPPREHAANIALRLTEVAREMGDRPAIVEYSAAGRREIAFEELARRVSAVSAGLLAEGLLPGDRVLVFVPMSIDLYVLLLAVFHAGATAVFVDAWADRRRLDAAVSIARPRLFVGTPKAQLLRLASPAVRRIPRHWIAGGGWLKLSRYERPGDRSSPANVPPEHPALITFTTGSTGRPKAAARSHAFLWAQHEALQAYLRLRPDDVDMPTLPVFVLNNLALGISSVLPAFDPRRPAEIDPERIFHQMAGEGVTTSSGSPAFYQRLGEWCLQTGRKLPLRALFTGGAPVLPPLARLLRESVEGEAFVVYGSTEAEPIAGIEAGEMVRRAVTAGPEELPGLCVGHPLPELGLKILRAAEGPVSLEGDGWGRLELPAGEPGEIVVTGDHVLPGYLDDPEADRENKIRDGARVWHRTGDGGYLDAEGLLWLTGRVKSRVRRAGRVWWSTPVEIRALSRPEIRHAAYLGMPDPELGQHAVLCVETPGEMLGPQDREALVAAVAPAPVDRLVVLARIPRDPRHASKTDMEALRRLIAAPE